MAGISGRAALALIVLLGAAAAPASAAPMAAGPLTALSGASPFADACSGSERPQAGAEAETSLAVDPRDSNRLLAAWQQDRFRSAGALSTGASLSTDGGSSWQRLAVPGTTACPPAGFDRASDPWLSFGGDGTAYLATLQVHTAGANTTSRIVVNHSVDGGATWSEPVAVVDRGQFEDKEALTADPVRPGTAYLVWAGSEGAAVRTAWLARTSDGGATWTPPLQFYTAPPGYVANGNVVGVLPDGSLVDVVFQRPFNGGDGSVVALRSEDQGATWSAPVTVGPAVAGELQDAERGHAVRTGESLPTLTVAPGGDVFVGWETLVGKDLQLRVARSVDGGRSFATPVRAARASDGPFTPVLASGPAGVALSYADARFDRLGDREFTTSMWIAHSHDAGQTWSESRIGAPFDLRRGPQTSGKSLFLGDYSGLVPLPDGFGATLVEAPPAATQGRSDVFFSRATLGRRPTALRILVTLHPGRIRAGKRSLVKFVVRGVVDGARRPLGDARVKVGSAHAQTNAAGRVSGFFKLGAGNHRVVVTKPGFRRATAVLRATRR